MATIPPYHPIPDQELSTRLAQGEEAAFNQVYHRFAPTVFNAIMLYIHDESNADELLQQVFVKVWEKREMLAEVGSLENYLFIMARNLVLTHLKKLARVGKVHIRLQAQQPAEEHTTDQQVQLKEQQRLLQQAVEKLPAQQKTAWQLAEDGYTYEEIAERMKLSRLTVKKHLELSRRFVRTYMNHHLHGFVTVPLLLATLNLVK